MDQQQKRILAIVLIIVIGVGTGVTVFLVVGTGGYETPGVSGVDDDRMIKIGLLGGLTEIQGEGNYRGAWLAAHEINSGGGVQVNGETYYIGLAKQDTDESNPQLDVSKGVAAAEKILEVDGAEYIVGGFRTESLKAYLEVVMDAKKLFIGTGASTDSFCQNVLDNYDRYKYWFRIMPINSTVLGGEVFTFLGYMDAVLEGMTGKTINKAAIIREDLDWTLPMDAALNALLEPALGIELMTDIAYPITATATDFTTYWNQIDDTGAQIVIPIVSAQGGIHMMKQYSAIQPGCVVIGIDVQSQLDSYWDDTAGGCEFETIMQPLVRTNKTGISIEYWDAFQDKWGDAPLYTASGAYDAVNLIAWAIEESQSFDQDTLVAKIEGVNAQNPLTDFSAMANKLAFTSSHDLLEGWPYGVTLFGQWQDGEKICVPTSGFIYPDSIATGTYQLPDWEGWEING
ncbi:MAG: hypothetical protein BAJALOKI2v1_980010 [Promethearchaeota archaeon]|nr:MAG: hypothetical protein BAJALOKI2v1_980010 [Candidatus Lokiarchaeota archaeon]